MLKIVLLILMVVSRLVSLGSTAVLGRAHRSSHAGRGCA